ncbi:helix-turn-helix domain-containing protein [Desulfoluna spongiiphila]|uniref:helix-turn-helix domain-containing protein n=1 Tax=Desulfoluna spongiiphila TaxID=419481 RepID=UPI0012559455|nr:helix-turn-helix domain-containing protein [Desulfoluna spongiiphila]VVS92210.1 lambda repressor-like dna-binding domain superfamily [Desulfoluna spongiiphila]
MNIKNPTVKEIVEPMENIVKRLRSVVAHVSNGNARDFARKCDIPYGTLQGYFRKRLPHAEHLIRMANNVGVNINWLLTGNGEMFGTEAVTAKVSDGDLTMDLEVLHRIIKWVEEYLARERKILTPDKKAQFIALAYEYFTMPSEDGDGRDVDDKTMKNWMRLVG